MDLFSNKQGINDLNTEAKSFESAGDYESAVYSYACAIDQDEELEEIKNKVISLIKSHGPFTFEKQLKKMKKEFCECCDTCGERYHHSIMKTINKLTT